MPFLNALFLIMLLFSSHVVQADSQLKLQPLQTLVKESFVSLIPDPNNPDVLYGITSVNREGTLELLKMGGHLYRSNDKGAHWTLLKFNATFLKMVIDPADSRVLYAVQQGKEQRNDTLSVLKSVDSGKTWVSSFIYSFQQPWMEFGNLGNIELVISPVSQNLLYTVLYHQLYRSYDAGNSWKSLTLPASDIMNIVVSPSNPQLLFCATRDGQLFKSHDAGINWQGIEHNIPLQKLDAIYWVTSRFTKLWMSQSQPTVLYLDIIDDYDWASSHDSFPLNSVINTYKSSDSGQTWQMIPKPPIPTNSITNCYSGLFYIDPYHQDILYSYSSLCNYRYMSPYIYRHALYRSQDGGNTWNEILRVNEGILKTMLSHSQTPETVYVSIIGYNDFTMMGEGQLLVTENTGKTWTNLDSNFSMPISFLDSNSSIPVSLNGFVIHPSNPKIFYAMGEDRNIYQTVDGGHTFTPLPSFVAGSSNNATISYDALIGATENAVFGSKYRWMNQQWQVYQLNATLRSNNITIIGADIYRTDVDMKDVSGNSSTEIYSRSRNNGQTWQTLNSGRPLPASGTLVNHPTEKNRLYLYFIPNIYQRLDFVPDIYQSLDDGATWQNISGNLPVMKTPASSQLIPHPTQSQTLYFCYDGYVHKTLDNGKTWKIVGSDIISREAFQLWFDPNNSQTMYAMLNRTDIPLFLYKSTDSGETWRNVSFKLQDENSYTVTYEALRFAPNDNKIIYIAKAKERMYQSEDGEHWEIITDAARLERESPTGMLLAYSLPNMKFKGIYRVENQGNAVAASLNMDFNKNYTLTKSSDTIKVQVAEYADQAVVNLKRTEPVTVQAKFEINNTVAYGQPAAFFVVARYQPLDSSDSYWFMQTEDKQWIPWEGDMEKLQPTKIVSQLQPTESLDIFTGAPQGLVRTTSIYAAYRPAHTLTTVSNQNTPLVLNIE